MRRLISEAAPLALVVVLLALPTALVWWATAPRVR